ncbi:MAG: DegT/DnrJ/EryC1/StrS family aminotransferase, partial [Planctomycetaceae bacterium]
MSDETFDFSPPLALPAEQLLEVFRQLTADGSWQRYSGQHGTALQQALLTRHNRQHCHLCCSGTAAMELALRAAGVQAGDEVILCAYDFKSNFINVLQLGARPVLVDTLPNQPVLDTAAVAAAITPATSPHTKTTNASGPITDSNDCTEAAANSTCSNTGAINACFLTAAGV